MKLTLTFEIEVNEEECRLYHVRWPGFEPETPEDTLIREAVAAWDSECLVISVKANGKAIE